MLSICPWRDKLFRRSNIDKQLIVPCWTGNLANADKWKIAFAILVIEVAELSLISKRSYETKVYLPLYLVELNFNCQSAMKLSLVNYSFSVPEHIIVLFVFKRFS